MEKVKKHIQNAFTILSAISVQGDNVDLAAAARQELRQAFSEIETAEKTERSQNENERDGEVKQDG